MLALAVCIVLVRLCSSQVQDDVYERASRMKTAADSLQNVWRVQWKHSDSIRISSILIRMRSDSLKRGASALIAIYKNDSTSASDSLREAQLLRLYNAALVVQERKNASALTASDSITAAIMVIEPDSGIASFYGNAFHGKKTSNGEVYNMNDKTCAHRWLPFGTLVRVRNLANGKETLVRVNDRGPWKHGRIIDLSKGAAQDIDMIRAGTTRVELRVEPKLPVIMPVEP